MEDLTTLQYIGVAAVTTITAAMFLSPLYLFRFAEKEQPSKEPAQRNPDSLMFKLAELVSSEESTNPDLDQRYTQVSEVVDRYNGIISQHNKFLSREVIPSDSVSADVLADTNLEGALKKLESQLPAGSAIACAKVLKNTDRLYLTLEYTISK